MYLCKFQQVSIWFKFTVDKFVIKHMWLSFCCSPSLTTMVWELVHTSPTIKSQYKWNYVIATQNPNWNQPKPTQMQKEDYAAVIIRYVWSVNRVIVSTASSLSLLVIVAHDMLSFVTYATCNRLIRYKKIQIHKYYRRSHVNHWIWNWQFHIIFPLRNLHIY